MVVANENDADGGDLLEVHGTVLKPGKGIVGRLDDKPECSGKMKSVLPASISSKCVKAPRERRGDRKDLSSIQISYAREKFFRTRSPESTCGSE
jgi:hypothetical protein